MTKHANESQTQSPWDWLLYPWREYSRFLSVAQELRSADNEMMTAMLGTEEAVSRMPPQRKAAPDRRLTRMMKRLGLNFRQTRRDAPELGKALQTACAGCSVRARCDREFAGGTAGETYAEFCPNAPRFDALLSRKRAA